MVTTYRTPGVYVEEISKFPPSIAAVDTAIPAFIGYTQKAEDGRGGDLTLKPTRIESLVEFEQMFGKAQPEEKIKINVVEVTEKDNSGAVPGLTVTATLPEEDKSKHILYYALQHFYANGGNAAYLVSVGPFNDTFGSAPDPEMLKDGLEPLEREDEPTLIVIPEAQGLGTLSEFSTLEAAVLTQCASLKDRFTIMDLHGGTSSLNDGNADLAKMVKGFRDEGMGTEELKFGAAYAPNLQTVLDYTISADLIDVTRTVDGVRQNVGAKLSSYGDKDTQLYQRAISEIRGIPLTLPPSGAIAGIYAKVDAERGVWKAPANVPIIGVIRPTIDFAKSTNDRMNVDVGGKSINAIRPFVGKGTLVWGARTLAGNDNEWRYVSVRRFFNFAEESIKKATEQFVFEPNDANTWVRVQAMIENFLTTQWRAGALQGVKPEHAFYVSVGLHKTMSAQEILDGLMIIEIGLAVVRPAEFIVLRFSHKLAES